MEGTTDTFTKDSQNNDKDSSLHVDVMLLTTSHPIYQGSFYINEKQKKDLNVLNAGALNRNEE